MKLLLVLVIGISAAYSTPVADFIEHEPEVGRSVIGNSRTVLCGDTPKSSYDTSQKVISELKKFTVALYQKVGDNKPDGNILISTPIIAAILSMVQVGARGNTYNQIKKLLNLEQFDDNTIDCVTGNLVRRMKGNENFTLEAANQIYVADEYTPSVEFQNRIKNKFGAASHVVDFTDDASRLKINKWVEEATNRRIKELLPEGVVDTLTRIVMVNALYFKGAWLTSFNLRETATSTFYLDGSLENTVNVPMMFVSGKFRYVYYEDLNAEVLELPYGGDRFSMIIVLPDKPSGLPSLEQKLTAALMDDMVKLVKSRGEIRMDVTMPKFRIETSTLLKEHLMKMGIVELFTEGAADLTGISGKHGLYVADLFHKTFIEVNEEGCEAAAAAGVVLEAHSMPLPFEANHPFMFIIRDAEMNTNLFVGRVMRPLQESRPE